jgi:methyl-accepting chemotaxis protein
VAILAEVRDAAFSVSTSSSEILATSTEIAKGAQYGRDQVHSTTSAVEEMAASMRQIAQSSQESADAAQQVLEHLGTSDRAVDAAAQGMRQIDHAVEETAEKMRLLGERSGEVFAIIDLIEEIASRSELLSLNASIEAAHAGDAGRGFAVVAEEMRHLSERSSEAIKQVTDIVKGMAAETRSALAAMERSTSEVKRGVELSAQAREGLRQISVQVERASRLAGEISLASHEQTLASQTVSDAMQIISNITEQSSVAASETTKAVRDLVTLSESLTQAIARFTIEKQTPDVDAPQGADTAVAVRQLATAMGQLNQTLLALRRGAAADQGTPAEAPETALRTVQALSDKLGKLMSKL